MENLTFEQCSRIYGRLGGFKTAESIYTLVRQGYLNVVGVKSDDLRYSKYPYRVSSESFIDYLQVRGFSSEIVEAALLQM